MKRKGPILPPGAAGSFKQGFRNKRQRRGEFDEEEEDGEGGFGLGDESAMPQFGGVDMMKKKKKKEEQEEEDDLSEDEGDEEAGAKDSGKVKQRDRTRFATAALRKQGIVVDSDGEEEAVGEDEEEFREHLKANESSESSGLAFQSGKEQTGYQAPTREKLEALFGRRNDSTALEGFNMGDRASKHMYGKRGQVLEEEDKSNKDAWLEEVADPTKASARNNGGAGGMDARAFARIAGGSKKADTSMGAPIRKSKDPMVNLEIILSHVKPSEVILAALRRLGARAKAGKSSGPKFKKKNVRKHTAVNTEMGGGASGPGAGAEVSAAEAAEAKRAFEELTEAAQSLLQAGEIEIYSETYESVNRVLGRLRAKKAAQEKAMAERLRGGKLHWQYKWNPEDPKVHGPFVGQEMNEWKADGYFKGAVVAQRVGPGHAEGADMGWIVASSVEDFTK